MFNSIEKTCKIASSELLPYGYWKLCKRFFLPTEQLKQVYGWRTLGLLLSDNHRAVKLVL